jgi:uncharacterized protein HemX
MTIKTTAAILAIMVCSCKSGKQDSQAEIQRLNQQSLKCISIMNDCDAQKTAAMNAGNADLAATLQKSIDSAATENAKIGQQLMELQAK